MKIISSIRAIISFISTITLLLVINTSCSREMSDEASFSDVPVFTKSVLLQDTVWDEILQMYLFPYKDSSVIENTSDGREITHRAIIVRPKNERQQRKLEMNPFLSVRYIPFGWEGINSYTVNDSCDAYGDTECSIDTESLDTIVVPKLYVYWPVSLEIPDSLDYEEAYVASFPKSINEVNQRSEYKVCRLTTWDTLLGDYVPAPGVKIVIQPGIVTAGTTNANGYFYIPTNLTSGYVYAVLQSSNWTVTSNDNTAPKVYSLGTVSSIINSGSNIVNFQLSSSTHLISHRSAYCFYHDNHLLSNWNPSNFEHIRIAVLDTLSSSGKFKCHSDPPFIQIRQGSSAFVAFHELGHYAHYCRIGGSNFVSYWDATNWYRLIVESFGSFADWHVGTLYYNYLGYFSFSDFTGDANQGWNYTGTNTLSRYSPLFVDIIDDYNQYNTSTLYLYDPIYLSSGFTLIQGIIDNCYTISSLYQKFHEYDTVLGETTINNYLDYYNYWYNNNL